MYIGVDIGGTNLVAGLVDDDCKVLLKEKTPTLASRGGGAVIDDVEMLCRKAAESGGVSLDDIKWIGVGCPGTIDKATGTVVFAANISFKDTPLCGMLSERLGKTVYLENDANAAALGEVYAGAAKGARYALMVTLGTGIGGGIVIDKKIYSGCNACAGEFGHTVIVADGYPCNCGRKGCWETYASATGLIRLTRDAMLRDKDSVMWEMENGSVDDVSGRTAYKAARQGDKTALEVVELYTDYLSCGIANMLNIFQPEVVCIGGGVSHEGEYLLDAVKERVQRECFPVGGQKPEVKLAQLGNDAGVIGAAMLGK